MNGYKLIEELTVDDILISHNNRKLNIEQIEKYICKGTSNSCPYVIKKGQYNALHP
jgi:hypothetical protein